METPARKRETSAGVVVFAAGRVLVIRNRFGEWVLPKGKVEPEESLEAAAVREVEEETGISAVITGSAGRRGYTYRSEKTGEDVDKVVHWFLGEVAGGASGGVPEAIPQAEEGITAAAFVPWRDAAGLLTYDGALVREAAASLEAR